MVSEYKERRAYMISLRLGLEANLGLEAIKFADNELSKLCSTWMSEVWDELAWERVRELQVRDILDKRQSQAAIAQSGQCLSCPQFLKHVSSKCSSFTFVSQFTICISVSVFHSSSFVPTPVFSHHLVPSLISSSLKWSMMNGR